ncbi:MAG: DMT family transporter [Chloroflexi bacterium]|nr:DMT family transporter [Chloroflexota bacterium]
MTARAKPLAHQGDGLGTTSVPTAPKDPAFASVAAPDIRRGFIIGFIGVVIFALSLPMTRLATGSTDAPQLSGVFVAFGRAVVAGALSIVYLAVTRAPRPARADRVPLAFIAGGVVIGFPLCMSVAMRYVESVHGSAILGFLPLATAVIGAWVNRQRPPAIFWGVAALGSALVMAFPFVKTGATLGGFNPADLLLFLSTFCAATGYVYGARLARTMTAEQVICWGCVVSLAGFFFWYRGLALGGTVRISQVQLVQPILGMIFSVPLLGETLDAVTITFGLAIVATVFLGRRLATRG